MRSAVNPSGAERSPRTRPVYVLEFIWRKKCLRAVHCTRRAVRMLPLPADGAAILSAVERLSRFGEKDRELSRAAIRYARIRNRGTFAPRGERVASDSDSAGKHRRVTRM